MGNHFAWAVSAAVMVCALSYCAIEESRLRKDAELAKAKFCVEQGGTWASGWLSSDWCDYSREAKP